MRLVIIGAVAAGTSAAAKARRNSEEAEIIVYEKGSYISYSGCGMPYYLGGEVKSADELTPRDPAFFKEKYNIYIHTSHEVLAIHPTQKALHIRNRDTDETFVDHYDKLIIATGANAIIPSIAGVQSEHVFHLRSIDDMYRIKAYIDEYHPKTAVIIGTGFVGLEVCENLLKLGMDVTLLEKLPHVTPGLDSDLAVYVQKHIEKHEVRVLTDVTVSEITQDRIRLLDGREIMADMVLVSAGVRPNTELAKQAGVLLGLADAICVDKKMQTNLPDIYACGDCIEHFHVITQRPVYRPLGSTANKTGRIAGDSATGGDLEFRGVLGTGIFRVFDLCVAQTGLSEREARTLGYDFVVCHNIKYNKPEYLDGSEIVIKGIADRTTGRLIGAQIIGFDGVDKRIDVFVAAISFRAKAEDLFHLDMAYAPPFSTTKDPVMYTGMILDNVIHKSRPLITAQKLKALMDSGEKYTLIDTRPVAQYQKGHIETAQNIPLAELRNKINMLDKDVVTVTYCNKGVTGNAAQNILINSGFNKVYNLSGGYKHFRIL